MGVHFQFEGVHYELPDGTTPEQAKQKILGHLGKLPKEEPNKAERSLLDQFGREVAGTGTAVADFISQAPKFLAGAGGYALARAAGHRPTQAINAFESAQTMWRDPSQVIREAGFGEDGSYTSETQGYKNVMKPFELLGEGVKKLATTVSDNPEVQAEVEGLANIGMLGVGIPGLKPAANIAKKAAWKVNPAELRDLRSEAGYSKLPEDLLAKAKDMASKSTEGFVWNPETKRMEKGNLYIDPITNTIQDSRAPMNLPKTEDYVRPVTQVEGIKQLEHQAGEPLITFPDGTTMTRAEYNIQRGLTEDRTGIGPVPPTMTPRDLTIQDQLIALEKQVAEFPSKLTEEQPKVGAGETASIETPKLIYLGKDTEGRFVYEEEGSRKIHRLDNKIEDVQVEQKQPSVRELALEEQRKAGWDDNWPFVPADLLNADFRKLISEDPSLSKLTEEQPKVSTEKKVPELPPEMVGRDVDITGRTNPYFGVKQPQKINVEEGIPKQEAPKFTGNPLDAHDLIKYAQEIGIPTEKIGDSVREGIAQLRSAIEFMETGKKKDGSPITFKDVDRILDQVNARPNTVGNAMVSRYLENFKKPESGVGGKQGGAVNFGFSEWAVDKSKEIAKKLSEADFTAELQRMVPGITETDTKKLWREYSGDQISVDKPANDVVRKIPGLKNEVISPELQTIEEMIPKWKNETDAVSSAGALSSNLSAGGRHVAQRTGNSFIDWNVENILTTTRKAQVIVKEKQGQIKQEVNKLTKGLFNKEGDRTFVDTMTELLRVQDRGEMPNVPREGQALANTIRNLLDEVGLKIQEELATQGINFKWRSNYMAHVFNGPYRVLVKDTQGNTIGVVSGKTNAERVKAMEWVKERMPEVEFGVPEYNRAFDNAGTEYGKRYAAGNEILNALSNDSPISAQLQNVLGDFYYQTMKDYMGYRHHIKPMKGVFGYEGGKGWKTAKENAYDVLEAQLSVIDHAYHWLAEQKLARDMQKLNEAGIDNMPQAREYVNMYLDHAFGRLQDKVAIVDSGIKSIAEGLGIAPSAMKEGLAIARNFALVNALSSTGNMFANIVQGITHPNLGISKAMGEGLTSNPLTAKASGFMDTWNVLGKKFSNLSEEGKYFYSYFKEHGVGDPHLVEHTIARKMVPTTGMGPIKKAVWGTVNGVAKLAEVEARILGKYFIEEPEKGTRMYFAMTMAHYYRNAGLSLKEAAIKADKDTSTIFTDYTPQERAMMFQRMGELGKFTSTVSTYKMNMLNQMVTFKNSKNYAALAALGAIMYATGGLVGMPGMDEIEYGFNKAKGLGLYDGKTPKEVLMSLPDIISMGPMSQAPLLINKPAVAIHRKFASDDVVPDSLVDFLYPLTSFWTNKVERTWNAVKTPTKENKAAWVREMVPGNAKYIVDRYMLTDEQTGITRDVNTIGEDNQSGVFRTPEEHRSAAVWSVPTTGEWKAKQLRELNRIDTKVLAERKKSLSSKATQYLFDGNGPEFYKAANELLYLDPNAANELKQKIKVQAQSRGMTIQQYMQVQLTKGAVSKPGIERFQKYTEMTR